MECEFLFVYRSFTVKGKGEGGEREREGMGGPEGKTVNLAKDPEKGKAEHE